MTRPLRWILGGLALLALASAAAAGVLWYLVRHVDAPDQAVPHVQYPPAPPPPRWSQPPRYRIARAGDSWQVLDELDRVVILRGVQAGDEGLRPPLRPVPYGDIGPFEQWKAMGFNAIRLPVPWEALEPEPRRFDRDHLDYLRWFLDQAWRFRMAVLLTPFQYRTSRCLGGLGAPAWAHRPGLVPDEVLAGDCRDAAPGGWRQAIRQWRWWTDFYEGLWTPDDLSLQDHLIDSWQKLAEVLYNHPAVLGYEVLDGAPCPAGAMRSLWPMRQDCSEALAAFQRRFAQAIRNVDRDALVLLGLPEAAPPGGTLATDILRRPDLDGIALAAAPPDRPRAGSGDSSSWRRAECRLDEVLRTTADLAADGLQGPRLLVGFGVSPQRPGALEGLFHQALDIEAASASAFVGIPLLAGPPGAPGRPRCLASALVRPFPMRVAGTDVRWSFDRSFDGDRLHSGEAVANTDAFLLTFRQGSSTADTLVFIPRFSVYRDDPATEAPEFTIDVSDGEWRWAPGEPDLLVWTTRPEVPEHRLVLRPWGGRRAPGNGLGPDCEP